MFSLSIQKKSSVRKTLAITVLLLAFASASHAQDWNGRLLGQWISSSSAAFGDEDFDDGFGIYLGLERRLGERWGIEVGVGRAELEASQTVAFDLIGGSFISEVEASLQWTPVTVGANYHLTPRSQADVYIGPRIGVALADDLELVTRIDIDGFPTFPGFPNIPVNLPGAGLPPQTTSLETDDAFIYGARLGLDWPLGDGGWALSGAIDYTVLEIESEDFFEIDVDPLAVSVGVSKSW